MNRREANFGSEAAGKTAEFGNGQAKPSCCCGGGSAPMSINRTKEKETMTNSANETKQTIVTAPEIVCGGCASSIKKALGSVQGVSEVDVDVATKKVTVKHDSNVSREKIADALDRAGYSVA